MSNAVEQDTISRDAAIELALAEVTKKAEQEAAAAAAAEALALEAKKQARKEAKKSRKSLVRHHASSSPPYPLVMHYCPDIEVPMLRLRASIGREWMAP